MRSLLRLSVVILVITCAAFGQLAFQSSNYVVNTQGLQATSGDFNRDGWPDLAIGTGANTVQILLNDHSGHFTYGTALGIGESPTVIATADLNNDGALDLVVAHGTSTDLQIWWGRGTGQFYAGTRLMTLRTPYAVALGDFDGDGRVDIADVEYPGAYQGYTVNVYHNDGNGTFSLASELSTTSAQPGNIAGIDLNRDGRLDLAVAMSDPSRVLVYYGNGAGSFSAPVTTPLVNNIPATYGEAVPWLAVGDFDDDATPDVAVTTGYLCGSACGQATVHILHNDGSGNPMTEISSFVAQQNNGNAQIEVGDLNGDFHQDLIVWNGAHYGGDFFYFLGDGTGHFSSSNSNFGNTEVGSVVIRDFNLDSGKDIATSSWMGGDVLVGLNTSFTFNCSAAGGSPGAINARFCNPIPGETVPANSPITVEGAGNSPAGIIRMELWVDGVKQYQIWNDQLKHNIVLSPGSHSISLVAVDRYISYGTSTAYVTASTTTTDQPPIAALSVTPDSGSAALNVSASTANSTDPDGTIASSTINFGDGAIVNSTTAQHTYTAAGTYTVTATVTDNMGVSSSTSRTVSVAPSGTNIVPQTGWWWDPNLSGIGFFIEYGGQSANGLFVGGFLYDSAGNPTWLVSTGQYTQSSSTYSGNWLHVTGGQTLTGPYQAPQPSTNAGSVAIQFTDPSHAVMTRPDGSRINIQRFSFTSSATPAPPQSGAAQNGWWWGGSSLSGTGYGLEIQGNQIFAVAYVYDSNGNPVWYLASGTLDLGGNFTGTWDSYAGGPQLTSPEGTYSAHKVSSATTMSIQFSDSMHGLLKIGNESFQITRFTGF